MENLTANNVPYVNLTDGQLTTCRQNSVDRSNFFSEKISPKIQAFAQKHPLAAVIAGLALSLVSILAATAATVFVGPVGLAGYLLLPVGLALMLAKPKPPMVGGPNDHMIEEPKSMEAVLTQAVDKAFGELPKRMSLELSKFPTITPGLAKRYKTTVGRLLSDQSQAIKTLCLHTVLSSVKAATDEHWDRHSRQSNQGAIDQCAKGLILEKLEHLQSKENLNQLLLSTSQTGSTPQSTYGVSQREFFALNRVADFCIAQCFSPSATPVRTDREVIESCTGAERKDAYIKTCAVMAESIEALYVAFDQFVRTPGLGPDMRRVSAISQQFSSPGPDNRINLADRSRQTSTEFKAQQWLLAQKTEFTNRVNEVFNNLPVDSQGAFRNVMLKAHTQQAGNLKTAFVQELAAFSGARQKLEQIRQEVSKGAAAVSGAALSNWMRTGLDGLSEILDDENYSFCDLREALDDNRSGTPWKDSRLHEHMEKLAGSTMMEKVRPEHRAATLDSLAAYGEKTVKLFNDYGLSIVSGQKNAGLADTEQPSCTAPSGESQVTQNSLVSQNTQGPPNQEQAISFSPYYSMSLNATMGVGKQINFKDYAELETLSHFHPDKKSVFIDDYSAQDVRGIGTHELGHALDAALATQMDVAPHLKPVFLSERYTNFIAEFKSAVEGRKGITVYSQADETELFAESAAAYLGMPCTADKTYSAPSAPIKSKENLWEKHPVIAQFMDEVLRAPTKVVRAANTPLGGFER